MERPERCIDPIMKSCQYCKYGYVHYPEWVETHEDLEWADIEEGCIWGLEDTSPTEEELKEFDKWYEETFK